MTAPTQINAKQTQTAMITAPALLIYAQAARNHAAILQSQNAKQETAAARQDASILWTMTAQGRLHAVTKSAKAMKALLAVLIADVKTD